MKWTLTDLKNNSVTSNKFPPLVLLYGDDAGNIRQHTQTLIAATGIDTSDPFSADKIDVTDLMENTARLAEAAGTISLMGGQRLVWLQGVNADLPKNQMDAVLSAVKGVLSSQLTKEGENNVLIVIPAPHVGKAAALVKAVEKDKAATAVRLFQDSARDMGAYVNDVLKAEGKTLTPEARALLLENLGADRELTQRELEKLVLYVGMSNEINADDVVACLADAPAVNVFKLCDAIGNRDLKTVDTWIGVLLEEGEDANMLLSLAIRHLRRVLQVKQAMHAGKNENAALSTLTPPVFFGKHEFMEQVRKASLPRLQQTVTRALQAQYDTRELAIPPELHLRRTLLALTA